MFRPNPFAAVRSWLCLKAFEEGGERFACNNQKKKRVPISTGENATSERVGRNDGWYIHTDI